MTDKTLAAVSAGLRQQKQLEQLLRVAVIGLRNQPQYDDFLVDEVRAQLETKQHDTGSGRFLDALTLSVMRYELASLPTPEVCEWLPDEPVELLQPLSHEAVAVFGYWPDVADIDLILMAYGGYALPASLMIGLLRSASRPRRQLALLQSDARMRWMLAQDSRWIKDIGSELLEHLELYQQLISTSLTSLNDEECGQLRQLFLVCHEQMRRGLCRWLGRQSAAVLLPWVRTVWSECRVDARNDLLSLLLDCPLSALAEEGDSGHLSWLLSILNDRSPALRQRLHQWLSVLAVQARTDHQEWPQLQPRVAQLNQQLALCLCLDDQADKDGWVKQIKQRLVGSPLPLVDVRAPEEMTEALLVLGIQDPQDNQHGSKAADRLGQLLQQAGPRLWCCHIGCSEAMAVEILLHSRYAKELAPFVLKAVLCHRSAEGLQAVIALLGDESDMQLLAAACVQEDNGLAPWLVRVLVDVGAWSLLMSEPLQKALLMSGVTLSETDSLALWYGAIKYLRRGFYSERLSILALLLTLPVWQLPQLLADSQCRNENNNETVLLLFQHIQKFKQELHLLPVHTEGEAR